MRWNPVFRREMTVGSRSIRMMAILFVFNSILAAVALFNMYSVAEQVRTTAEIQYSQFLDLYTFVSSIEFIMLLFIMPALTASSISGERERQTLELMLTTTMEPRDMVLGKLASSLVTMLVLAVSALPVQALVFVYGGVTLQDIGMLFLCHGVVAILTGSIGIFYSSVLRRSTVSTVCSYVTVVALTAGTMAVNLFAYRMALRAADSYASNLNASEMASSGILRYLFLFNPAVSFYNVINGQAGSGDMRKWFEPLFGVFPDNAITAYWTACSLILQCMLAMVLIAAAVWAITPGKWNRHGKNKGNDNR